MSPNNPSRPSALFEALLPPDVATAQLTGAGDPALLLADEHVLRAQAAPARVAEFAAGRLCARRAAARFGILDCPIGAHADRRPRWPQSLTGSITHTAGFTAAAVGERRRFQAIGIDAERIGGVSPDLWSRVLLPAERDWLERLPVAFQVTVATLLFSAREAFYKCQYEVTRQWLDFHDVAIDCFGSLPTRDGLTVRPVGHVRLFDHGRGPVVVRYAVTRELVLTALTIGAH